MSRAWALGDGPHPESRFLVTKFLVATPRDHPSSLAEILQVRTCRCLEDIQPELRKHCQEMIEDVTLDSLVFDPTVVIDEDVNLNRQAVFRRLQLPNQEGVVL